MGPYAESGLAHDLMGGIENSTAVVAATPLRHHKVYKDMYKLTAELLIFKVTPWVTFMIIFLTLTARIRHYCEVRNRTQLTVHQFHELQDSRIILGTILLFYISNALPVYVSVCHVFNFQIDWLAMWLANMFLVLNSSLKFFIYVILSRSFRKSLKMALQTGCKRDRVQPTGMNMFDECKESRRAFLDHVRVAATVQAQVGRKCSRDNLASS